MGDKFSAIIYLLMAIVMAGIGLPLILIGSVCTHIAVEFPRMIRYMFDYVKVDVVSLWNTGEYADVCKEKEV